jgi:2-succinyl-5-enolpyruvyl-6-hydroxy-3-cyclohexene-1-carboxylate synthase
MNKILQSQNLNYLWANLVIEELVRLGVNYFCISPGSRSTPLTMAAAEHPKAETFVHFDERGLAFHALGRIAATKSPCAIISTSGTAVANFFPAVIEASKKKSPLIILTADRPPELRFTGADQTIDQVKIYGEYVRWQMDMPCPTEEINPKMVLTTVDQAVYRAQGNLPGPVHLNFMFREPLTPIKTKFNLKWETTEFKSWITTVQPFTTYLSQDRSLSKTTQFHLLKQLKRIKNGLIVAGKLSSDYQRQAVLRLAHKLQWPVFPDITSGLRTGERYKGLINYFDQLLLSENFQNRIDIGGILHLGGRMTSKRYYQFLEKSKLEQYIMILNHPLRNDPTHQVTLRVESDVGQVCAELTKSLDVSKVSAYATRMQSASQDVGELIKKFINNSSTLSEISTVRIISENILPDMGLFLASSMPIRDMDMYANPDKNFVEISSNRGASGIDGTIASAGGFSQGLEKPVTLLIGDLAFLHDINSLAMIKDLKHPMVVVVINNNGGGIFSFLPIADHPKTFEKYFGTPHHLTFESAAQLFKIKYCHPQTNEELTNAYQGALKTKQSTIIEVRTERANNLECHNQLQQEIHKTVNMLYARK